MKHPDIGRCMETFTLLKFMDVALR